MQILALSDPALPELVGPAELVGLENFGLETTSPSPVLKTAWALAATISMAASAYHGYKRNDSVGWAVWWGFMGSLFPVFTPVIAVAQGFAKPKRR